MIAALIINVNVKHSKQVRPEKLVPLSIDEERKKQQPRLTKEEVEFMMENWK